MKYLFLLLSCSFFLLSCSGPSVPDDATRTGKSPVIFPDYVGVTVPCNLCPVNFMLPDCEEAVARMSFGGTSFTYGEDNKIIIDEEEWEELCSLAAGNVNGISVEVYGKKNGQWFSYNPFAVYVAKDSIDPYISYRLIQPSYVVYEDLDIMQRDITCYDETVIYTNRMISTEESGQCINCHSYQNYDTNNMLFHMRQNSGGTMIVHDGKLSKVDLKTDSTISAGVYPAWNSKADLIAFSTNKTRQFFHSTDKSKIEVYDTESDLILYDIAKNEVSVICNDTSELESFPTWSPDGTTLYYTSAHISYTTPEERNRDVIVKYQDIKYNVYSRSFDIATRKFGEPRLVFDAASVNMSATLPRVSPDGRYLTFSLGHHGCFHVWHPDADICVIDLHAQQNYVKNSRPINSSESESYPSFSSNGRWIMTASRRDDGNYTRPYISYFDAQGNCRKAFAVPQKDPEHNTLLLRSYNRPEFMKQKVQINPKQFAAKAKEDAVRAKFRP